ncbi:IRK-interacting protein-like isoform X1 [Triticum urartu]|uniref:GIL1/IRKI C-terminal domain-containing protein n=1 Tax=Triticum urartu TaxID=4572 RepID=A0A8R7UHN1_TRIUA|nr:IRK-interacting protein-like isoform X1 [Triticum urartu]
MAMAAAEGFDHAAPSGVPLPATRQEVQAAVAKAVELRALHAALRQRAAAPNAGARSSASRSPATIRLPPVVASPARSRTAATAAADEDYPVFTPTYDEEPMAMAAGLNDICHDNRSRSENWGGITLDRGGVGDDEAAYSDYDDCINGFSSCNSDFHYAPSSSENHLRSRGVNRIHPAFLQSAPLAGRFPASAGRATCAGEFKMPPSCGGAFRPATIGRDHGLNDAEALGFLGSSSRVPFSSSHQPPPSAHSRAKQRGSQILSWLFAKGKKKPKLETPPPTTAVIERGNMSQLLKEWGLLSLDSLRKELAEANAHRDAAQEDAAEMRSSLGELTTKMMSLEAYCSELKKALRQATDHSGGADTQSHSRRSSSRSIGASRELPGNGMPVSHEAMVEGFLQIASEARLSVKQLCKALIQQVEEPDNGLSDKLNLLLRPHQLAIIAGRHCSKAVLYHLEAVMNQTLYQDFENPSFQRNGAARHLDPGQGRRESFASFVALRNLSWSEVLRKGTRYYSEDLSRFCDQKMSCVVAALSWSWPWPEQLLQCFFVATKCVWLLHLLAFSFAPPLPILRVDEGRAFDQAYMEDILPDRRQAQDPLRVKVMVMPGFYVQDRVLKCKVLTTKQQDQ